MFHLQHISTPMNYPERVAGVLKRLGSVLATVAAIGLATGAAFLALLWLDSSMRFLTPAVIRLGQTTPAGAQPVESDAVIAPMTGSSGPARQDPTSPLDEPAPGLSIPALPRS